MKDDICLVILSIRGSISPRHGFPGIVLFFYIIRNKAGSLVCGAIIDYDDAIYKFRHRRYHVNYLFLFIIGRDNNGNGFIVQHRTAILAENFLKNGSVIQEW